MTALCGGGSSGPAFGAAAITALQSGSAAVLIEAFGAPWMALAIPFLVLPNLILADFCSADPPAIPTFSQAEADALVKLDITSPSWFPALGKLNDLLEHLFWRQSCVCTSGALTALPPAPPQPAGSVVISQPPPLLSAPCFTYKSTPGVLWPGGANYTIGGFYVPPGLNPTAARWRVGNIIATPPGEPFTIGAGYVDKNGAFLADFPPLSPAVGQSLTVDVPVLPGAYLFTLGSAFVANTTGSSYYDWQLDLYCGTAPGQVQTPCCPPDPATAFKLDAILNMVTLIQRQAVPFSYLASTVHAGLSGAGSIAIQGLLGVRVDITAFPLVFGQDGTSPAEYFLDSFITFGTPDGFPTSIRIEHHPQLALPARCSAYTVLDYDLAPGMVASITELKREA